MIKVDHTRRVCEISPVGESVVRVRTSRELFAHFEQIRDPLYVFYASSGKPYSFRRCHRETQIKIAYAIWFGRTIAHVEVSENTFLYFGFVL